MLERSIERQRSHTISTEAVLRIEAAVCSAMWSTPFPTAASSKSFTVIGWIGDSLEGRVAQVAPQAARKRTNGTPRDTLPNLGTARHYRDELNVKFVSSAKLLYSCGLLAHVIG
jgi:hypothetical protein